MSKRWRVLAVAVAAMVVFLLIAGQFAPRAAAVDPPAAGASQSPSDQPASPAVVAPAAPVQPVPAVAPAPPTAPAACCYRHCHRHRCRCHRCRCPGCCSCAQ
jgi:hypothetical protein